MSNTLKRIIGGAILAVIVVIVALLEHWGIHAVRWIAVIAALGMITEMILAIKRADAKIKSGRNLFVFLGFLAWLIVVLFSAYYVGARPWMMLLLLMIICCADIGAWFFGKILGGDKMWERLSPHKTWSGQIAGIICGTAASIMYGMLGTDTFLPQLLWIGISVSLLSQYGDLTASWIKRRLGLKDFGNIIPGHGGFLDRFDGWIYALPVVWFILMH